MSHTGRIIGIPGLEIERVARDQDIEVWAKPSFRPRCKHCSSTGLKIKATHSRTVKHTRQGNQAMTLHLRVLKYYCPPCRRYFRHTFVGMFDQFDAPASVVFKRRAARQPDELSGGLSSTKDTLCGQTKADAFYVAKNAQGSTRKSEVTALFGIAGAAKK